MDLARIQRAIGKKKETSQRLRKTKS